MKIESRLAWLVSVVCALAVLLTLTGCAGAWQNTYAGAKTMATYVEDVHENGWSKPLNARVDECEASLPAEATAAEVDECLGPFAENDKVVDALEAYDAAAEVLGAVLLATDPSGKDQSAVLEAWGDVMSAALDLVALFPEAETFTKQLKTIARKAGQ